MPPNRKLYLLPNPAEVSPETIAGLEELLKEAKAGNLTGFAYVALHRGAAMSHDVMGRCRLVPILTLGMVRMLQKMVETLT